MDAQKNQRYLSNRVSNLQAHQLDTELDSALSVAVDQLELPAFSEELKTLLQIYLCFNIIKSNATTGMKVYNLDYADISKSERSDQPLMQRPNRYKLTILAASNLIGSYVVRSHYKLERALAHSYLRKLNLPWLTLDNLMLLYRSLSVLNFIVFLRTSKYLTVAQRVLTITPALTDKGYSNNVILNRAQIDYIFRERIWQTLSEFLTIVIPMINVEKLKNQLCRLVRTRPEMSERLTLSEKISRESNARHCAICLKQPFNPYIIGCRHVFCYYCINAKYLIDPSRGYACSICNYSTKDQFDLQRFKALSAIA